MAGAGVEVGRISVKVTPDTDGFRNELRRQLKALEKQIQGDVPIKANLDSDHAVAQLRGAMAKLRASAGKGVTIPLTVDQRSSLASFRDGLRNLGLFARDAKNGLSQYTAEVKRLTLEQQKASPLLMHDLAVLRSHNEMRKRGAAALREFADGMKITQVRLQNMGFDEESAKVRAWEVAIRDANKNLTNSFRSFKNGFASLRAFDARGFMSNIREAFRFIGDDAEKAGGQVEHTGRKIFGMTRIGWIIAAVFMAAAPAVGLIAGLIAGLPSLMLMFAAGAGAVALGLDGIKAAAQTVQPQFEALRATLATQWQEGLTPIFQQLSTLFPIAEKGFGQVTTGLLNMAQGITTTLTSAEGMRQLEAIFAGIGGFFTSVTPAMQQFTNSFLQLGAAGANSMGHLTAFLAQFATQWQGMVDRVTNTPVFDNAMKGMSQALSGFTGLFTQLMESGLGAMAELGGPLQNMFSGFGNMLSAAMPALTAFSAGVANVIGNLGNSLAPAFAALEAPMRAIMPVLEQFATFLGTAISQAVVAVAPALTQLANILGPVLSTAMTALAPILQQLASTLGTVLLAAVQALAPIMPQIAQAFVQLAQAVSQGLAQILPLVVQAFIQLLPVIIQLIPVILQLVPAIVNLIPGLVALAAAGLKLLTALMPLINLIVALIAALASFIATLAQAAAAVVSVAGLIVSAFVDACAKAIQAISDFVGKVVDFFSQLPGKIKGALGDLGGLLVDAGKALMDGLLNGIKAGWEAVKGFVGSIAGWIADLKGPIPYDKKVLIPNGEALMEGLNTGLENGFDGTLDRVKSMAKAIFEAVKEVFGSANGLALNLNFNGVGGGGGGGLVGGLGALGSTMSGVTTQAKDFQSTIAQSVNPSTQLTADAKAQVTEYSRQLALLEQRRKELELMRFNDKDNQAIKNELELIRQQKLAIGLEKDKLTYAQKYEGTVSSTNDQYQEQIKKLTQMPIDFAKTTASTALSDFGIPGQGALGALADYGMELGTKFIFNVSNVDEAMAVQQNQVNKQGMGVVGR